MACACNKTRVAGNVDAKKAANTGTYQVMVGSRKVYETTNVKAADAVAARFADARVVAPGGN